MPRRSIVQVRFPKDDRRLTYYNESFDLHCGDIVFVEGAYEGVRGRVMEVNYNFKIKLSDYKKVISVADTDVQGRFYMAGSHFLTFNRSALPVSKVKSWYLPVQEAEKEERFYNKCWGRDLENTPDLFFHAKRKNSRA